MLKEGQIWSQLDGTRRVFIEFVYRDGERATIVELDKDFEKISHFRIIGGIEEFKLISEKVQPKSTRDPKITAAFVDVIKAWERRSAGDFSVPAGFQNCALCKLFFENKCADCPIKGYTGKAECLDTPYKVFHRELMSSANINVLKDAAVAEVRFLENLQAEYLSNTQEP